MPQPTVHEPKSKTLVNSNVPFDKEESKVRQYGDYLAGVLPKTVTKSDTENAWILEFGCLIGEFLLCKL